MLNSIVVVWQTCSDTPNKNACHGKFMRNDDVHGDIWLVEPRLQTSNLRHECPNKGQLLANQILHPNERMPMKEAYTWCYTIWKGDAAILDMRWELGCRAVAIVP